MAPQPIHLGHRGKEAPGTPGPISTPGFQAKSPRAWWFNGPPGRRESPMPLGHIGLNVTDLARAEEFFDELMPMLALEPFFSTVDQFSYRPASGEVGTTIFFHPALEAG